MELRSWILAIGAAVWIGWCCWVVSPAVYLFVNEDPALDAPVVSVEAAGGARASAVVISPKALVTATHFALHAYDDVSSGEPSRFKFESRHVPEMSASTVWENLDYDLAMLEPQSSIPKRFVSGFRCGSLNLGEEVRVVGYPTLPPFHRPQGAIVTKGIVASGLQTDISTWKESYIVDARAAPGSSGGAVFDNRRQLVGILVGIFGNEVPSVKEKETVYIAAGYSIMVPTSRLCRMIGM